MLYQDYVDGKICHQSQIDIIMKAVNEVKLTSNIMLWNKTGYCTIGAINNLNNANASTLIGANMILAVNCGLDFAIYEQELNLFYVNIMY